MGILIIIAVVWLCVRLAEVLGPVTELGDPETNGPQDQDWSSRGGFPAGPQDALLRPQDTRADVQDVTSSGRENTPSSLVASSLWREVTRALREFGLQGSLLADILRDDDVPVSPGDPHREWLAALRQTILDTVPRPDAGPAYLGGRDDDAYLRGWDDAVDWISQGRDAKPPAWGDIAYMTGWNDGVKQVASARRSARAWPSPALDRAA